MNRNALLGHLLRGTLAAGAVATSLTTGVAFAEQKGQEQKGQGQPAQPGAASLARRRGATGTIASIDAGKASFVLTTQQGALTVTTDAKTAYHAPKDEIATFAQLAKDLRVVVEGERTNDTTLLAQRVNLLPVKGEDHDAKAENDAKVNKNDKDDKREGDGRTVTAGAVSGYTAGGTSFTLTPTGGSAVTYQITADTRTMIKGIASFANGATARVISKMDGAANKALRIRVPAAA